MPSSTFLLEPEETESDLLPLIQTFTSVGLEDSQVPLNQPECLMHHHPAAQLRLSGAVLDLTPLPPVSAEKHEKRSDGQTPRKNDHPIALTAPVSGLEPTLFNVLETLDMVLPFDDSTGDWNSQDVSESVILLQSYEEPEYVRNETLMRLRRKSVNTTECVEVPTSEHVAEIVGRQGCKIKALRAKTNTYIKTPSRGETPVFVVTGRKEDVAMAKREILSAAEHFSLIRASRNKTPTLPALLRGTLSLPGQITIQVRVPYPVVGLVVGPRGSTIKRIQQQTHTYITTPGREQEPVFEVSGMAEDVERARDEIRAHIALRTFGTETDLHRDDFLYNGTDVSLNDRGNGTDDGLEATGRGAWLLPHSNKIISSTCYRNDSSSSNYLCDMTDVQRNSTCYRNNSSSSLGSTSGESLCSGGVELRPVASGGEGCRFWFSDVQLSFGSDGSGSFDGSSMTAVSAYQQQALWGLDEWGRASLPATPQLSPSSHEDPPHEDTPIRGMQQGMSSHLSTCGVTFSSSTYSHSITPWLERESDTTLPSHGQNLLF